MIPCYWESQPSGCLKAHCSFLHTKPRPQLPNVTERVSQFKFAAIDVKSLDDIRKGTTKETMTSSNPGDRHATAKSGAMQNAHPKQNNTHFGVQNSTSYRFSVQNHKTAPPSSHSQIQSRLSGPAQNEGTKVNATMPSFKLGTVLKDVVSRLNSSPTVTLKSSSNPPTSTNSLATTTSTGAPIPTLSLYSSQGGSIFNTETKPGSIFASRHHHQDITTERAPPMGEDLRSTLNAARGSKESSIKSTPFGDINIVAASTQNKRPRQLEVDRPEAKRVSPWKFVIIIVLLMYTYHHTCILFLYAGCMYHNAFLLSLSLLPRPSLHMIKLCILPLLI